MEYMSFSNWTRIPVEIGMEDATRGKMECQMGNKAPRWNTFLDEQFSHWKKI